MKTKAYTFIEIMATLMIIGFIFVITAVYGTKISADSSMARYKKGYANLENTVANLIKNPDIYGGKSGFRNIRAATLYLHKETDGKIETIETGEIIGANNFEKFRDGFKYYLDVVKEVPCNIYPKNKIDNCLMTDDGVVFGIPNTNFDTKGTIKITDSDGDPVIAVPITMYVDFDESEKDPSKDAFVFAIEYDGTIHILRTYDKCTNESKEVQCKLDKYINSDTILDTNEDKK